MRPAHSFHPSNYGSSRDVFSFTLIDYARQLPFVLGSAFACVWTYDEITGNEDLERASRFLTDAIMAGRCDGSDEVADLLQKDLDETGDTAWDSEVLVLIARGGMKNVMQALTVISSRLRRELAAG